MVPDWKAEIARIAYWKQITHDHDPTNAFPWHFPKVGATRDRIQQAQSACGVRFSEQFQDFLALADGWLGFYVLVDLFGTQDFIDGRALSVLARPELAELLADYELTARTAIPIGASEDQIDTFIHVSPDCPIMPGGVIWFANEEVDSYATFEEFLGSMVNYNAQIARELSGASS
jgi:transglutaminase-like putative cysteine protease